MWDSLSIIFMYMVFKIKLEDKAAFLNRMEKAGDEVSSNQIKDNKLEGYFEVTIDNPKQLANAKSILNKSPKINTIKEMKKGLTKSELKEMIRQQLRSTLAEKKKMKDEDKKEKLNEAFDLNSLFNMSDRELELFLVPLSWFLGIGGIVAKAAIADFKKKKAAGEIKSKEDVEDILRSNAQ